MMKELRKLVEAITSLISAGTVLYLLIQAIN